jgi:valyl-tRNA synthetase
LRADHGLDRKLILEGVLYCHNGSKSVELGVIEKLANVKLDVRNETAPKLTGAVRSTPEFDLALQLPEVDAEGQRARVEKEKVQLKKLIADKDRQLANEKFLSSAPASVVAGLREKRGEYVARLAALSDSQRLSTRSFDALSTKILAQATSLQTCACRPIVRQPDVS